MEEITRQAKMNHHQPHQRQDFTLKKVMLCIQWDWRSPHYELLPEDQMINSSKYAFQLDQMKAALSEKHPELVNKNA